MGFGIHGAIRSFASQAQRTLNSATAGLRQRSTPARPKAAPPRKCAPASRPATPARTAAPARRPSNPLGGLLNAVRNPRATLKQVTRTVVNGTRPLRNPALGALPTTVTPRMDPGGTSLQRMVDVLKDPKTKGDVTVFNIGFNAEGPEKAVRDALLEYRQRNPGARIRVMVYEPSWGSFPNNRLKLDPLFSHPDVNIQVVFPPRQSTRTVMHAKGLVAGDRVVLSTAAVAAASGREVARALARPAARGGLRAPGRLRVGAGPARSPDASPAPGAGTRLAAAPPPA